MMKPNKQGFTLIEALMSVAIMAIGFAGVYAIVGVSNKVLMDTVDKQKLGYQTSEIMETLYSDKANLLTYHGRDLSNCTTITPSPTGTDTDQIDYLKSWCKKVEGEIGQKKSGDSRLIRVVKQKVGAKDVYLVSIDINGKSNKKSVYMTRLFYVKE